MDCFVGFEIDHPSSRCADGGAGRKRHAAADRPARHLQEIVRRRAGERRIKGTAEGDALVDDDRIVRQQSRKRLRDGCRGNCA